MNLNEAARNYVDNGGPIAIKGYNFQHYVCLFLMMLLYKLGHIFEISPEKDDDISLINNTFNKSFKLQVKSMKITYSELKKKSKKKENALSIIEKLYINSEKYDYVGLIFGKEKGNIIKNTCVDTDKYFGTNVHSIDCVSNNIKEKSLINFRDYCQSNSYNLNKLFFHETPFTTDSDNCLNYLLSYAANDYEGKLKSISITKTELLALLGTIYHCIDKSSNVDKFDNNIFKMMEKENEKDKLIFELTEELKSDKGVLFFRELNKSKVEYVNNKRMYDSLIEKKYKLEDIDPLKFQIDNLIENIKKSLEEENKKIINDFIIIWYIIYNIVEREFKDENYN